MNSNAHAFLNSGPLLHTCGVFLGIHPDRSRTSFLRPGHEPKLQVPNSDQAKTQQLYVGTIS